jgi:hypothetical protein
MKRKNILINFLAIIVLFFILKYYFAQGIAAPLIKFFNFGCAAKL